MWLAPAPAAGGESVSVNGPLFYLGATAAVAGAVLVVTLKDLRTAVMAFAGFGLALGLLLLVVGADLVAGLAVLVFTGVVPAVVLAGMVLTTDPPGPGEDDARARRPVLSAVLRRWPLALGVAAGVSALLIGVAAASRGDWVTGPYPSELLDRGTTATLGHVLFNSYALPFAGAGVLLLAAAVGATVVARRDRIERDMDRAERERAERAERVRRRREDRIRAREGRRPGDSGMAAAIPGDEDGG
ncbi:MAG: NADH-quinone oxidoreductase subunit J [Chloroflexi bacterium]|nr:MAG: NADH-quinone oxidoreductase subunit J [Chloroflexota bacterium]TMD90650.1 MAG: NADH-quinone oxidoreductase subunit J [Chloroflexota bacterium]